MSDKELEAYSLDDINSILDTIDELVSVSDNKADIASRTFSLSRLKTDELKAEGFVEAQLDEIAKGIEAGLPVDVYAKQCYNWMQMYEIRRGLLEHLDIKIYESPLYSASQMREIRLGMLDHLDVSSYASLVLSSTDMHKIRIALFVSAYKTDPTCFGRTIEDDTTGIILRISDDCMNAYIKIPDSVETELSADDLLYVLESHEIVYGILEDNIQRLVNERPVNSEICVAQGKHSIPGREGWYELFFENCIEKGHTVPPDGEIDYTDANIVDIVEPGQVLAKYHPAQKDSDSITVTGITIEGTSGQDLSALNGTGFRWDREENTYIATRTGCISYNDTTGSLNVWNVYQIHGDVCYYQSLEYDGSVHISGSVRNTATIRAKGDIIIDGFVESAIIYSEQNIVIKGGANGGGQGRIEAGGSIRGNFFENIDLFAKGMVEANYFLNSNIVTDDRVIARGRKARIIGGNITAAVSVDAVIVGNYLGGKSIFNVGDIHSYDKRIGVLSLDRKKALNELQQLSVGQQKLTLLLGEDQVDRNALYNKTCLAIQTKELQVSELEQEINRLQQVIKRAEKAYIKVHGQLLSEVIFIINGSRKETPTTTNRSIFLTRADRMRKK